MVSGDRDWEFCFGCVEFAPVDVLVDMTGRLLDRWVCSSGSLCLRIWASAVRDRKENKTQSPLTYAQGITGEVGGVWESYA